MRQLQVLNAKVQSGDYTAQELTQFLDLRDEYRQEQAQQERAELLAIAEQRSTSAASEARARSEFSVAAMGQGNDYDTLKAKYVEPLYQQAPLIREVISQMKDPARFEMYAAVCGFLESQSAIAGDPVKLLKTIFAAVTGAPQATGGAAHRATVTNIQEAATRGAERMLRGGQQVGSQVKSIRAEDIATMPEADFAAFKRQHGAKL
jgi:hypothetical protein